MNKKIFMIAWVVMIAMTASAFDLKVKETSHGSVTLQVDGSTATTAEAGQVVTIQTTADALYHMSAIKAYQYAAWGEAQTPRRAPGIENREIALTKVDSNTYTFTMPSRGILVEATFSEGMDFDGVEDEHGEVAALIHVTDVDEAAKTLTIASIDIPAGDEGLTIYIPSKLGGYTVNGLASGAISNQNVSMVHLAETKTTLKIGENAIPTTATIHTPLELLDDYALMPSLKSNFEAGKVVATATPVNVYWTFSCGVDVVLPEGITVYTCRMTNADEVRIEVLPDSELTVSGQRVIKAGNGLLLYCNSGRADAYLLTARPGNQQSGSTPVTADAHSYGDKNWLLPVVEAANYSADGYLVLKNNTFHSLLSGTSMVPANRAILKKQ